MQFTGDSIYTFHVLMLSIGGDIYIIGWLLSTTDSTNT